MSRPSVGSGAAAGCTKHLVGLTVLSNFQRSHNQIGGRECRSFRNRCKCRHSLSSNNQCRTALFFCFRMGRYKRDGYTKEWWLEAFLQIARQHPTAFHHGCFRQIGTTLKRNQLHRAYSVYERRPWSQKLIHEEHTKPLESCPGWSKISSIVPKISNLHSNRGLSIGDIAPY